MALGDFTIINGVTKSEVLRGFEYQFPALIILADVTRQHIIQRHRGTFTEEKTIVFADLDDKLGTTNVEDYLDQCAILEAFFFDVPGGGTLPPEFTQFFENELVIYTLYEVQASGVVNGTLAQLAGVTILRESFQGLDLDVSEVGLDGNPIFSTIEDSNGNEVGAVFNPITVPPDWLLTTADSGGQDYALVFKVRGTRKILTDYLSANPTYFIVDDRGETSNGQALVTLDEFEAITSQALSPTLDRTQDWVDVEWATSDVENNTFLLLPDNITFQIKNEFSPVVSAHLNFLRTNGNGARTSPFIRLVYSLDGGLNFIDVNAGIDNSYIRSSNVNSEFTGAGLPRKKINTQGQENVLVKLQTRVSAESDAAQTQWTTGYIDFLSLTNESAVIPVAPVITNPLPDPLEIPSSELFSFDLGILNATNVQLVNAPPNSNITNDGILTIQSPSAGFFPNFQVVATNNAPNPTINAIDLTVAGFQNLFRVSLNGAGQYLRTEDNGSLDFQRNQFNVISMWLEMSDNNVQPIIEKYDYGLDRGLYINMDIDERFRFKFSVDATRFVELKWDFVAALNTRYHVVFAWLGSDANECNMYINGSLQSVRTIFSDTADSGDTRNGERFNVAFNQDNGQTGEFIIDELCVWRNFNIDDVEVAELYNLGLPLDMSLFSGNVPQNWWRMGEGSTIPIINNEQTTDPNRQMSMINASNNIIPF